MQARLVAREHVLDYRQPEPRAAGVARAAPVHSIEALREARDVLWLYSDAGVGHAEDAASLLGAPCEPQRSSLRRVAHGVRDEVEQRAVDFLQAAPQVARVFQREID